MLRDTFDVREGWNLEEAKGEVDGISILAKVRGPHFVPDGMSRNTRYYPKELWDRQINNEEVKTRLTNRTMFGTIGHPDALTAEDIREGKVSHFTSKMWIDENNNGMAESYILNTPAGRVLNTLLRAKCKLYSSSRANGMYKEGQYKDGAPIVDPDHFDFKGFDFVVDPGFLEANPKVVENLSEDFKEVGIYVKDKPVNEDQNAKVVIYTKALNEELDNNNDGGSKMDLNEKLIGNLQQNQEKLQSDLLVAQRESITLKKDLDIARAENEELKGRVQALESLKTKFNKIGEDPDKLVDRMKSLTAYEQLGESTIISEKLSKLAQYEELGDPEIVSEALDKAKTTIQSLKETVAKYEELGTPEQISTALEKASTLATNLRNDKLNTKAEGISKKFGVKVESIRAMLDKGMTEEEIEEVLKEKEESTTTNKYEHKSTSSKKTESAKETPSRASRILETLS
jgi:hypothetical protein